MDSRAHLRCSTRARRWVAGGACPARRGNRHPSIVPYETYETADRPLAIAVGNDRLFARLCEAVGLPELADDARFATNEARVAHADELADALDAVAARATPPTTGWRVLRAASVPAGPINEVDEAFALAERARHGAGRGGRRRPADPAAAAHRRRAPADPPAPAAAGRARRRAPRLAVSVTLDPRFNGPPGSAHGGYTCGVLGRAVRRAHGGVAARAAAAGERWGSTSTRDRARLVRDRRGAVDVVAEAVPAEVAVDPRPMPAPEPPAPDDPVYGELHEHPFPTCFACGPDRAPGDGMRIFASRIAGGDGRRRGAVDAATRPRGRDGIVRPIFVWAALDCPTGHACAIETPAVLARLAVRRLAPVRARRAARRRRLAAGPRRPQAPQRRLPLRRRGHAAGRLRGAVDRAARPERAGREGLARRLAGAAGRDGLADRLGEHEAHVLAQHLELRDVRGPAGAEEVDQPLHELLGRAGAGGDADDAGALEPLLLHLRLVVDQVRVGARGRGRRRPAGWSSTSCASRSPARGRTARPSA